MITKDFIAMEEQYGAHNYHPLDVVIERAEGVWVYDVDGRKYLDCLSAYSALNQGHVHPQILNALLEQAKKVTLTSRAFRNDQLPLLYKELSEMTGYEMSLPMNSGAEEVSLSAPTFTGPSAPAGGAPAASRAITRTTTMALMRSPPCRRRVVERGARRQARHGTASRSRRPRPQCDRIPRSERTTMPGTQWLSVTDAAPPGPPPATDRRAAAAGAPRAPRARARGPERAGEPRSGPSRWTVSIERARIAGGRVEVVDRGVSPQADWLVQELELDARGLTTRAGAAPGGLDVGARINEARLAIHAAPVCW